MKFWGYFMGDTLLWPWTWFKKKKSKTKQNQNQIKQPQQKTLFAGPPSAENDSFKKKFSLDLWVLWPALWYYSHSVGKICRVSCQAPDHRGWCGFYRTRRGLPSQLAQWLQSFQNNQSLKAHSARGHRFPRVNLCTLRNSIMGNVIKFHI